MTTHSRLSSAIAALPSHVCVGEQGGDALDPSSQPCKLHALTISPRIWHRQDFPIIHPKLQCRDDKAPTAESQAAARLPFGIKMDEMKVNFSASKQSVVGENISTLLDSSYLLFIPSLAGGFAVSCSLWGSQGAAGGAELLGHEAQHVSGWEHPPAPVPVPVPLTTVLLSVMRKGGRSSLMW